LSRQISKQEVTLTGSVYYWWCCWCGNYSCSHEVMEFLES